MGKRTHKEEEERIKKKIRKLEKKLMKVTPNRLEEDSIPSGPTQIWTPPSVLLQSPPHPQSPPQLALEPEDPDVNEYTSADNDQLPLEFLLALGKEGQEEVEQGEPLRPELALRWSKIMTNGLDKEARTKILGKYPIPSNFSRAVAPAMNPEIMATLSEPSIKRDRRIVTRQNLVGKLMICLGRSLTNIIKGNINSKILIEEINDAAKVAAEIYHEDIASRKFFAMAGATKLVQEAVKTCNSDAFLFGTDCSEKIRTAQSVQKTSTQIIKHKPVTKKLNWKSPPQSRPSRRLQYQHARGGQHRQPFKKPRYTQPHRQTEQKRARPRHYR